MSFGSTTALKKQLRSLLWAYFYSTAVKPKSRAKHAGIVQSSPLSISEEYDTFNLIVKIYQLIFDILRAVTAADFIVSLFENSNCGRAKYNTQGRINLLKN